MTFLKNLTKKVSSSAKVAARKSGDLVEVTKLGLNINSEEEKIQKAYAKIGEIVYKTYELGKTIDSDYKSICEEITNHRENIQSMKDKILFLKNIKICPQCNGELECKDAYCNMCGAKQEIPELCLEESKELKEEEESKELKEEEESKEPKEEAELVENNTETIANNQWMKEPEEEGFRHEVKLDKEN